MLIITTGNSGKYGFPLRVTSGGLSYSLICGCGGTADALDLGSSVNDVKVQVLSAAPITRCQIIEPSSGLVLNCLIIFEIVSSFEV